MHVCWQYMQMLTLFFLVQKTLYVSNLYLYWTNLCVLLSFDKNVRLCVLLFLPPK